MINNQLITDQYAIYESDCMFVVKDIPDASVHHVVYSPPFAGLYNYSSHENDFSNCESKEQFLDQYNFLVKELSRVTIPGRINAVHVTEIVNNDGSSWDFPHEVIRLHENNGFIYKGRITVWKEPLKVRMRTMVKSLMHKLIIEDSTQCFVAQPDYVLIFKRKGENQIPVTHPFGLTHYAGERPFLENHIETYGDYETFKKKWANFDGDPRENKLSHITWQRYASSVWDDVRIDNVLPFKDSREEDDEKHVHPLQLDVIDRLVDLYSNPGEVVLTPFMGVGSEVYSAVSMGRKAIGIELKGSYYKQAILNLQDCKVRFRANSQIELF
jgi:DNA modification methylase